MHSRRVHVALRANCRRRGPAFLKPLSRGVEARAGFRARGATWAPLLDWLSHARRRRAHRADGLSSDLSAGFTALIEPQRKQPLLALRARRSAIRAR